MLKILAFIGVILSSIIVMGAYWDITDFDNTKGGYEPPYINVTGEPVDWASMDVSETGLVKRGYIINILVNGTTGMISFEIFKIKIDWKTFSKRALIVHKPREALIKKGFSPEF